MSRETIAIWIVPTVVLGFFFWQIHPFWDPDSHYFYGWGIPFLTAYLVWDKFSTQPEGHGTCPGFVLPIVLFGTGAMVFRFLWEGMPSWYPLTWAQGALLVGFCYCWLALWRGTRWANYFLFPLVFTLAAIPWPGRIENAISAALTGQIAQIVTTSLQLLGIPAVLQGIQISIGNAVVEVAEACSGIRSLQFLTVTGLFLGAYGRFSIKRRVALLVCAGIAAFVQNAIRALTLGWITGIEGSEAYDRWHDPTGAVTFTIGLAILIVCFLLLEKPIPTAQKDSVETQSRVPRFCLSLSAVAVALVASVELFIPRWYNLDAEMEKTRWTFDPESLDKLPSHRPLDVHPQVFEILETDHALSGQFLFNGKRVTYHYIGWPEGYSVLKANVHNPSVCMGVNGGLEEVGERQIRQFDDQFDGISYEAYQFNQARNTSEIVALRTMLIPTHTREFFSYWGIGQLSFSGKLKQAVENLRNRVSEESLTTNHLILLGIDDANRSDTSAEPLAEFIDRTLRREDS